MRWAARDNAEAWGKKERVHVHASRGLYIEADVTREDGDTW